MTSLSISSRHSSQSHSRTLKMQPLKFSNHQNKLPSLVNPHSDDLSPLSQNEIDGGTTNSGRSGKKFGSKLAPIGHMTLHAKHRMQYEMSRLSQFKHRHPGLFAFDLVDMKLTNTRLRGNASQKNYPFLHRAESSAVDCGSSSFVLSRDHQRPSHGCGRENDHRPSTLRAAATSPYMFFHGESEEYQDIVNTLLDKGSATPNPRSGLGLPPLLVENQIYGELRLDTFSHGNVHCAVNDALVREKKREVSRFYFRRGELSEDEEGGESDVSRLPPTVMPGLLPQGAVSHPSFKHNPLHVPPNLVMLRNDLIEITMIIPPHPHTVSCHKWAEEPNASSPQALTNQVSGSHPNSSGSSQQLKIESVGKLRQLPKGYFSGFHGQDEESQIASALQNQFNYEKHLEDTASALSLSTTLVDDADVAKNSCPQKKDDDQSDHVLIPLRKLNALFIRYLSLSLPRVNRDGNSNFGTNAAAEMKADQIKCTADRLCARLAERYGAFVVRLSHVNTNVDSHASTSGAAGDREISNAAATDQNFSYSPYPNRPHREAGFTQGIENESYRGCDCDSIVSAPPYRQNLSTNDIRDSLRFRDVYYHKFSSVLGPDASNIVENGPRSQDFLNARKREKYNEQRREQLKTGKVINTMFVKASGENIEDITRRPQSGSESNDVTHLDSSSHAAGISFNKTFSRTGKGSLINKAKGKRLLQEVVSGKVIQSPDSPTIQAPNSKKAFLKLVDAALSTSQIDGESERDEDSAAINNMHETAPSYATNIYTKGADSDPYATFDAYDDDCSANYNVVKHGNRSVVALRFNDVYNLFEEHISKPVKITATVKKALLQSHYEQQARLKRAYELQLKRQ